MGRFYEFACLNCDFQINLLLGSGFLGPTCEDRKNSVRRQTFAKEWLRLVKTNPDIYFRPETKLLQCLVCHNTETDADYTLFTSKPNNDFESEYVTDWLGERHYLLKRFENNCSLCGSRLHEVDVNEEDLYCPECHRILELVSLGNWD